MAENCTLIRLMVIGSCLVDHAHWIVAIGSCLLDRAYWTAPNILGTCMKACVGNCPTVRFSENRFIHVRSFHKTVSFKDENHKKTTGQILANCVPCLGTSYSMFWEISKIRLLEIFKNKALQNGDSIILLQWALVKSNSDGLNSPNTRFSWFVGLLEIPPTLGNPIFSLDLHNYSK